MGQVLHLEYMYLGHCILHSSCPQQILVSAVQPSHATGHIPSYDVWLQGQRENKYLYCGQKSAGYTVVVSTAAAWKSSLCMERVHQKKLSTDFIRDWAALVEGKRIKNVYKDGKLKSHR